MPVEVVVAGWFASVVISRIAELLYNYAKYRIKCEMKVKENLDSLDLNLHKIETTIRLVERRTIENRDLQKWLLKLKEAVYDAEDVLETFIYAVLRESVLGKKGGDARELARIAKRFQGLVNEMGFFLNVLGLNHNITNNQSHMIDWSWRMTRSSQEQPNLVGRNTELSDLVSFLLQPTSDDGKNFSLISLLGVGGVGKTALARLAYNDPRVTTKDQFEIRVWVCVTHIFDVKSLMIMFIESALLRSSKYLSDAKNPDVIPRRIANILRGRKFLVVLDDVWNNKEIKNWLLPLFKNGKEGSKVIVTTRDESIATALGSTKNIHVESLALDECGGLLHGYAFCNKKESDPSLERLVPNITKGLCGLPLVVETIGDALHQNQVTHYWNQIITRNIYMVSEEYPDNKLLQIMRLSYEQLRDRALQQCFLSCSLFPHEHKFSKTELIRIWIALGFICLNKNHIMTEAVGERYDNHIMMETVGERYFNKLVDRQFFKRINAKSTVHDHSEISSNAPDVAYKMHGALHRLAEFLSYGEYYRVVHSRNNDRRNIDIPNECRHVSLDVNHLIRASASLKRKNNLRSLIITGQLSRYEKDADPLKTLEKILKEQKCLRMLILSDLVPRSIHELKHLRYFKVETIKDDNHESDSTTLPDNWLRKCCHLQSLATNFDRKILFLRKDISRLVMLRFLETRLDQTVNGLTGKDKTISDLQEVRSDFQVQKNVGFGIEQLGKMTELKGCLCISHLENVESLADAKKAELDQKEHLHSLELCWSKRKLANLPNDHVVLEGLKPHLNIFKLELSGYMGAKFPTWLRELKFLEQLSLFNCRNLQNVHVELKDMSSLKVIIIIECPGIHNVYKNIMPSNLERLNIMGKIWRYRTSKVTPMPNSLTILPHQKVPMSNDSTILSSIGRKFGRSSRNTGKH